MNTLLFARWFGIVSVLLSLGVLFNLEDAENMARSMVKNETGYIMGGVLPIIFGSLSLLFVTTLPQDWNIVVTLIGCAMLAAGTFRVFFVAQWKALVGRHITQIPFLFSLFGLMFGVMLLYVGYLANVFQSPIGIA